MIVSAHILRRCQYCNIVYVSTCIEWVNQFRKIALDLSVWYVEVTTLRWFAAILSGALLINRGGNHFQQYLLIRKALDIWIFFWFSWNIVESISICRIIVWVWEKREHFSEISQSKAMLSFYHAQPNTWGVGLGVEVSHFWFVDTIYSYSSLANWNCFTDIAWSPCLSALWKSLLMF